MCGIAGVMTSGDNAPDAGILGQMAESLHHRGPDGRGIYLSSNVGMIHTRLAIIDFATGAHPLHEPGGAALIGNGEIYNYIELRRELCFSSISFATNSDFEPALHLYRRLGVQFTAALRGMYAIAIHDPTTGRLILARDPFGVKPLYYVQRPGLFAFASEAHTLAVSGIAAGATETDRCIELLRLNYTRGRGTAYPGVQRLLPGECIVLENAEIVSSHRNHPLHSGVPVVWNEEEALELLDDTLIKGVALHQRADVPYGLFLSGGVDSTVLLATMARLNSQPVRTFTIGFRSTQVKDERALAKQLAAELGAEHTEVDFDQSDFWTLLPKVAGILDDPTADFAALPTYKLAQVASHSVKVVLTGEGGDEFFAGYGRYRREARPWWRSVTLFKSGKKSKGEILGIKRTLLKRCLEERDQYMSPSECTDIQIAQSRDIAGWLPNDLLLKLDRCLMAHSLEGRVPYVDAVLAEFAFRLPDNLKFHGRQGKYLLRKWLSKNLPSAQPFTRKRGFAVPVQDWMGCQADRLAPLVANQQGVRELCDPNAVRDIFISSSPETRMERWALLFFACWHQYHVCGVRTASDTFSHLSA